MDLIKELLSLKEANFTKYGNRPDVQHRVTSKADLDAMAVKRKLHKEKTKQQMIQKKEQEDGIDPTKGVDLDKLYMLANTAVGECFPDADPFEYIHIKTKDKIKIENLMDCLDAAVAKHHKGEDYHQWLSELWDQFAGDNPEFEDYGGDNNPWRDR